jgi:E3 ubiquitin-protein ligase MARCH6
MLVMDLGKIITICLSNQVVICDLGLACILGFLPFSLGRIILWCISCSDFCNGNEVNSYTSRVSILLTGYGFIISAGIISVVLNTFDQYLRGKRLTIAVFIRRLAGILLAGIVAFISFANFCLKFLSVAMYPMLFGWWLDIWASKIVGATMSERFKLLFASPFASTALHWLVGHTFSYLHTILFIVIHKVFIIVYTSSCQ